MYKLRAKKLAILIALLLMISSVGLFIGSDVHHKKKSYVFNPRQNNKKVESPIDIQREKIVTAMKNFREVNASDMDKINVDIELNGKTQTLMLPKYIKKNRVYIPLTEVVFKNDGDIDNENNTLNIKTRTCSVSIDTSKNTYIENEEQKNLSKPIITSGDIQYISILDFAKIFHKRAHWHSKENKISFYDNNNELEPKEDPAKKRTALIRLEDIAPGGNYNNDDSLTKLEIVGDYLYSKNVPFHIAWVPRYVEPKNKIDIDPSKENNLFNAHFIYTLDYLMFRGGIVGIHGYTHQFGDGNSVDSIEFGNRAYTKNDQLEERVNLALKAAQDLEIPTSFFEFPHYSATHDQIRDIQKYFDYIYEPLGGKYDGNIGRFKCGSRNVKFIPTPLDYVDGEKDVARIIRRITQLKGNDLGSFFYHPYLENNYIKVNESADGNDSIDYSEQSPLHRILKTFDDCGFGFKKIMDLN